MPLRCMYDLTLMRSLVFRERMPVFPPSSLIKWLEIGQTHFKVIICQNAVFQANIAILVSSQPFKRHLLGREMSDRFW